MPLSLLVGSAARPFGHSGPLHTGGAVSLMCGSVRRLGARPGPAALQSCFANFACNSLLGISKFEFISAELQRFWALLKVHSIELHAKFGEGRVGGCGGVLVRDFFLPACRVGGGSGTKFSLHAKSGPKSAFWGLLGEFCTGWACQGRLLGEFCTGSGSACGIKFSLHAKSGPKSAFWGLLGEFCTGWAAEPGSRASFVSLRARRGLHRAFLAPIAPPIDAAVMRCRYTWARRPCPTGRREPHPGSVGYAFIARRKPPARASCAGGRQRKHQQASASNASSANQTTGRPQAVQASRTHFFSSVTR